MKITKFWTGGLRGATPAGGWAKEIQPNDCVHTLIAVHTDEGITGWGSISTNDQLVRGALSVLEPLCLGENPLEPERVSETLRANTFWLGRGGAITHTISGIDIALWDILGKVTQQPVGRLLGGCYRDRVAAYASVLMEEPEPLTEKLKSLREQGFCAFKIGWGPFGRRNGAMDERIIQAARSAIGSDALLMVDAGASDAFWPQDYKWALNTSHLLAEYKVNWFEEPLPPYNLHDYVLLREKSPVRLAGGEVLTSRQSFETWIYAGALDIVQPDATKAGGFSEVRRIGWMAEDRGLRLIPHGWNTAVGLATDLQIASANRTTELVEYLTASPFINELTNSPWKLDSEGMLQIPQTSGIGATLNLDAVERYTGLHYKAF